LSRLERPLRDRAIGPDRRFDSAGMRDYWQRVSREHLNPGDDNLSAVCFAGMPSWFNGFMHRYQLKAFQRLVAGESFADCDVLDVGTGTGRWARWYAAWPRARVVGIDLEPARLARAASLGGGARYQEMSADALAFPNDSFDAVNSITVLQHIPEDARRRAIAEIARVLRPGGRAIVFEISDLSDDAPHVFPWSAAGWRREFAGHGLLPRRTAGEQYIPLLRLLKRAHRAVLADRSPAAVDAFKSGSAGLGARLTMAALRGAIVASYPIEECARFLPSRYGRISGFLFEKQGSADRSA
jgi:SAM-dependent methyltransferase